MLHSQYLNPQTQAYLQECTININNCFLNISRNNIEEILSGKVNDQQDLKTNLSLLFRSTFFSPLHRSHSLTHHHIYEADDKPRMSKLPGPMALIPLPDELKLYLASPIQGEALGWEIPDMIPSKDYKIESYNWHSLVCLALYSVKSQNFAKISASGSELLNKRIIDYFTGVDSKYTDNFEFELCFFNNLLDWKRYSATYNPGKVKHEIISRSEIIDLFSNPALMHEIQKDAGFDFLAYKAIGKSDSLNTGSKAKDKKTFVIFCDSLDINALHKSGLISQYPNLKKLSMQSVNYERFTSSGGWTYPCLFTLHSGLPPYETFSLFPSRVDPCCRLSDYGLKVMNKYRPNCFFHEYFYAHKKFDHTKNYISRKLENFGIKQFALKQAANNFWNWGIMHSLDYSVENYSTIHFQKNFDCVLNASDQYTKGQTRSLIYIDIDSLHQNIKPVAGDHTTFKTSSLEWFKKDITKEERLSGVVKNKSLEVNKYLDKLVEVDNVIGYILDASDDQDQLVLFSDNGSDVISHLYENNSNEILSTIPDSILTFPKIMKPTLLVKSDKVKSEFIGRSSNEIVSTIDMHEIIYYLLTNKKLGTSCDLHRPILPKSLNGDFERESAYTFSVTNINKSSGFSFELVKRDIDNILTYNISRKFINRKNGIDPSRDILEELFGQI